MPTKIERNNADGLIALLIVLCAINPNSLACAAESPALVEGASKEGRLVIYSLLAVPDHSRIVNHFREKYPFVEVSLTRPGASERITARVLTETRAGRPLVDVIGISRLHMTALIQRSLIMNYESPERARFDPAFKDRSGFWTAFYVNPEVTAYNTRLIASAAAPKAYDDLLEPRWNGQLAFEQTAIEWFATLLRHWGEDKGLAFMRRLAGNLKILNGNTLITQLVAAGEHAGAVSLNGPRVELTKRRGAPIEWVALDPTVVDVVTIGIAANAPHPHAAKLYLNHVLSRDVQETFLEEQFVKPSGRTDVKSAFMAKIRSAKVQMISVDESLGERSEHYEKLFQNTFKLQ